MKKYMIVLAGCLLILIGSSFIRFQSKMEAVAFPEGFREWNHIKSHVVGPNHPAAPRYQGFNSLYANDLALDGYRTGKWADGASIVVDVVEYAEKNGDYAMGKRKFIDVMVRDSKKYPNTGGWGWEKFEEGDRSKPLLNEEGRVKCFDCHNNRSPGVIVISRLREE